MSEPQIIFDWYLRFFYGLFFLTCFPWEACYGLIAKIFRKDTNA